LRNRILDINERRLYLMDEHAMKMTILFLNAPAVQAIPAGSTGVTHVSDRHGVVNEDLLTFYIDRYTIRHTQ